MYEASHKALGCTQLLGLTRLAVILDSMQKCVPHDFTGVSRKPLQFQKYQSLYRILVKELANTRLDHQRCKEVFSQANKLKNSR